MANAPGRKAAYPVDPIFVERWSPRAFAADPIADDEVKTILEAARWAPSSNNNQPWRFIYALREASGWAALLDLLMPPNRVWAQNAAALVALASKTTMRARGSEDVPSPTHSLDAGTASGFMLLQAHKLGWHMHGMAGFDRARANHALSLPAEYKVEAIYAVGRIGDPASLPEALQAREHPSDRLPLAEIAFNGTFVSHAG